MPALLGLRRVSTWLVGIAAISGYTADPMPAAAAAATAVAVVVPCAVVVAPAPRTSTEAALQVRAVVATFCAPGNVGRACMGCDGRLTDIYGVVQLCTNDTSRAWWQAALYQSSLLLDAAGANSSGNVLVSPATISIASALRTWQPLGTNTGVHVPSGVSFGGLCPAQPTAIVPLPSAGNSSTKLWSLVLVSGPRTGHPPGWPRAAVDVILHNLVISGVSELDAPTWRNCNAADSARGEAPSALPPSLMRVWRGIFLPYTGAGVHVHNCTILHTFGNAIETGVFEQWEADTATDGVDPACYNGTRFCQGKVYGFRGTPARPNMIHGNTICDARFGGITIIGSDVLVAHNIISVSEKTWCSASQNHGSTMGVSAAFVGSSSVLVANNSIRGGDYGVGTDGSFPLFTSVRLFKALWPQIYHQMSPAFRQRYSPSSPPLTQGGSLAFTSVQDYIDAQQVLLNAGVHAHVSSSDPKVYDAGFGVNISVNGNTIMDSVTGVSFYRQRASRVTNNVLNISSSTAFARWGIILDHSHNTTVSR